MDTKKSRDKWRLGKKVPLNVYEGDRPICQCHTVEDAALIVRAVNECIWRDTNEEEIWSGIGGIGNCE